MHDADADASNPEVMKTFYGRLFPWKQLFHWLNHEQGPFLLPWLPAVVVVVSCFGLTRPRVSPPSPSPLSPLHPPRVRLHARRRRLPALQLVCQQRRDEEGGLEAQPVPVRDWRRVLCPRAFWPPSAAAFLSSRTRVRSLLPSSRANPIPSPPAPHSPRTKRRSGRAHSSPSGASSCSTST